MALDEFIENIKFLSAPSSSGKILVHLATPIDFLCYVLWHYGSATSGPASMCPSAMPRGMLVRQRILPGDSEGLRECAAECLMWATQAAAFNAKWREQQRQDLWTSSAATLPPVPVPVFMRGISSLP